MLCSLSNVKKVNVMEIVTNNKPRNIVSFFDLKKKHQKEMAETFGEQVESLSFFTYKECVYCLSDLCVTEQSGKHWDAAYLETYFSAILIRLTN